MLVVGTLGGEGCFDGHYGHSFLSRNSKRFTRSCEIDLLEALLQWEVFAGHFDLCDRAFFFVFDTVTAAQNFFSLAVRPFLLLRDLPGAELELLIVPAEELLVAEAIGVYCGQCLKRESFLTDRAFLVWMLEGERGEWICGEEGREKVEGLGDGVEMGWKNGLCDPYDQDDIDEDVGLRAARNDLLYIRAEKVLMFLVLPERHLHSLSAVQVHQLFHIIISSHIQTAIAPYHLPIWREYC